MESITLNKSASRKIIGRAGGTISATSIPKFINSNKKDIFKTQSVILLPSFPYTLVCDKPIKNLSTT